MTSISSIAARKWADLIKALAQRVEANIPSRHDPEAFHAEKSEIASDLRNIARSLE